MSRFLIFAFSVFCSVNVFGDVIYSASSSIGYGGNHITGNTGFTLMADLTPRDTDASYSGGNVSSSQSGSFDFTGLDISGNVETMTFSYDSQGLILDGALKAKVSASLSNPIYNVENDPFVLDWDYNIDPNGVPVAFATSTRLEWYENLIVAGDASLDYLQFTFDIDGILESAGGARSSIYVFQYIDGVGSTIYNESVFSGYEFIESLFISEPIYVRDGAANLAVEMGVNVSVGPLSIFEIANFAFGSADFYNTLEIESVTGYDSDGNVVALQSVSDTQGNSFTISADSSVTQVPEPSSLPLLLLLLLFLKTSSINRIQKTGYAVSRTLLPYSYISS